MRETLVTGIRLLLRSGPLSTSEVLERLQERGWGAVLSEDGWLEDAQGFASAMSQVPEFVDGIDGWTLGGPTHNLTPSPVPAAKRSRPAQRPVETSEELVDRLAPQVADLARSLRESPATEAPTPLESLDSRSREWLNEWISAVEAELIHSRATRSARDVPIVGGVTIGTIHDRVIVRFTLRGDVELVDGMSVQVRLAERWHDGEIVSRVGSSVTISLSRAIPPQAATGVLRVDASFLLQLLLDHLIEIRDGDRRLDFRTWRVLMGEEREQDRAPSVAGPFSIPIHLNARQREAVARGVRSGPTWIWGPPGTGKTTTLGALIAFLVDAGNRVLLVSNTNAAADTALIRAAEALGDRASESGTVARLGAPALEELRSGALAGLLVDNILAVRGQPAAAAKQAADALARDLEASLDAVVADLVGSERALAQANDVFAAAEEEHRQAGARIRRLRLDLTKGIQRLERGRELALSRQDLASRERAVREVQKQLDGATGMVERAAARIRTSMELRQVREQELEQFQGRRSGLDAERDRIEVELADQRRLVKSLEEILKSLRKKVVTDARLVVATVHRTYMDVVKDVRFDVVVLDEASMVNVPLAACALGLGGGHLVLAGDFRQLPPIASGDHPSVDRWLRRSPFEAAGIDVAVTTGNSPTNLIALSEQHRMRDEIASLVSTAFYPEQPLVTARDVVGRPVPSVLTEVLPGADVWVCDTSALGGWVSRAGGSESRFNVLHAQVAASLLASIDADSASIGVISPYRSQARLLQTLLGGREQEQALASTVHRFQGGERDLIIYDMTEAPGLPPTQWFTNEVVGTEGARLLNVALSRARDRLLVVADFEHLSRSLPRRGPIAEVFMALRRDAQRLSWSDLLRHEGSPSLAHDLSVQRRLFEDLGAARHTAVISSDLTEDRDFMQLQEVLDAALRRGVKVRIATPRPPGDGALRMVDRLRMGGVIWEFRVPVRENCAVIDGQLVWASSGQLLSRVNSGAAIRTTHSGLASALEQALGRRQIPSSRGLPDETYVFGLCEGCRKPRMRVEKWGKDPYDFCPECRRTRPTGTVEREAREGRVNKYSGDAGDRQQRVREQQRGVGVHSWLIDDL